MKRRNADKAGKTVNTRDRLNIESLSLPLDRIRNKQMCSPHSKLHFNIQPPPFLKDYTPFQGTKSLNLTSQQSENGPSHYHHHHQRHSCRRHCKADRHQFSGSPPLADQIAWVGHCARSNIYQANNASGMCNAYI